MNMRKTKVLCLLLFICFSTIIKSQTSITSEERQKLEERFKDLKTFQIGNDGTVIYNYGDTINSSTLTTPQSTKDQSARVKVKVSINEDGEYVITTEEPDYVLPKNEPVHYPIQEKSNISVEDDDTQYHFEERFEEKKEVAPKPVSSKEVKTTERKSSKYKVQTYKNLDAAIGAVDDLLEQLKRQKEQEYGRNKNSLSRRASGGVDGSLRKNSYNFSAEDEQSDEITESATSVESTEVNPTYYVNGVEVTPEEYKKLKAKDILKRERRRSKSNPNGEWWVETRRQ